MQLLASWITGEENRTANANLFNWFVPRQDRLAYIDGMIYLCQQPTFKAKGFQTEQARIMLPKTLREKATRLAHAHTLNGHRGVMATYRSVARHYTWKGQFSEVMNFCRKCETYQSRRPSRGKYPPRDRPISNQPFHTVASDFSGVLGPSTGKEKHRYFLVFIDQLTRWPTVVPVKTTTTAELIKAIETHVMPHHGYMEVLIHDQGSAYTSKVFKEYAEARNITLNPVAKGNHRANGLAEKLVQQVHEGINKLADKDFKNWSKLLPIVEFNLRTSRTQQQE